MSRKYANVVHQLNKNIHSMSNLYSSSANTSNL